MTDTPPAHSPHRRLVWAVCLVAAVVAGTVGYDAGVRISDWTVGAVMAVCAAVAAALLAGSAADRLLLWWAAARGRRQADR